VVGVVLQQGGNVVWVKGGLHVFVQLLYRLQYTIPCSTKPLFALRGNDFERQHVNADMRAAEQTCERQRTYRGMGVTVTGLGRQRRKV
jgi:hypothetical protein